MNLPPGEPDAGPWRVVTLDDLLRLVRAAAGRPVGRPAIVAVDGRSASGKSTLAARLHAHTPSSAVVHTDDLAWHEPLFGWGHLLADDVLAPLRAGRPVAFTPPQWRSRGRDGGVVVPAGLDQVIVEGVGASHREHAPLVDVTVWVQSDHAEAERRGIARDIASGVNGDEAAATAFWHDWMRAELEFLAGQRPWERAAVVVNGTPRRSLDGDQVELGTAAKPADRAPPDILRP